MGWMMFDTIKKVFLCTIFDFYEYIRDWPKLWLWRDHLKITRIRDGRISGLQDADKIAIFAIYPNDHLVPFLKNALNGLRDNGFKVICVSTRRISDELFAELSPLTSKIIERPGIGRDFGSYQAGLRFIGGATYELPQQCQMLLIINDSLYYHQRSGDLFAAILNQNADWVGMFENNDIHYHVGGFFQAYRRPVFTSRAFRKFWRGYRPYSARVHSIIAGEVGLSTALRRVGFLPEIHFDPQYFGSVLSAFVDTQPAEGMVALMSSDDAERIVVKNHSIDPLVGDHRQHILLEAISQWLERSNPTHRTGLILNRLADAPLKRDICYRMVFSIGQVMIHSHGYTQSERDAMQRDLRFKGIYVSLGPIKKVLARAGRL